MASVIESLAIDGLLVAISDLLSESSFEELISQYKVQVPLNIKDKFRILQHIKKLDLKELAEKLNTLGYKELADSTREIYDFPPSKQDRRNSAVQVFGAEQRETQPEEVSPGSRKRG